jgi:hypothetical protein
MAADHGTDGLPGPAAAAGSVRQAQRLLDSFARLLGRELVARNGSPAEQAERLFRAPFVVVSHGTQADPVLNYGNARALVLWEMTWEELTQTPSRLTAEPVHRDERARLLARTRVHGFVDDYSGIRISKTGRRFRIEQAIVWNLADAAGEHRGQAATFDCWTPLEPGS